MTHGGIGEPVDWNGGAAHRARRHCDERAVNTPRARELGLRVRGAVLRMRRTRARATTRAPNPYDDDDVTSNHSNRWHLHESARLIGLRGKAWACWAGSAGAPTSGLAVRLAITPPLMPLQQQGAYGSERCDVHERVTRASSRSAPRAEPAPSGRTGDPELDRLDECAEWAPSVYARGTTRIVACDQSRLDRWLADPDDPDAHRTMTFLSDTTGDDAGPSIVAKRSVPTEQLGDLRLQASRTVTPDILVETMGTSRGLEQVRFEAVAVAPGNELHFRRDAAGTVVAPRPHRRGDRAAARRVGRTLGVARRGAGLGRVTRASEARRTAPGSAALGRRQADRGRALRRRGLHAIGQAGVVARVRARAGRSGYEIRPRVPRGTVSVRIRSVKGRRSVTTPAIGFAPKSRYPPPAP